MKAIHVKQRQFAEFALYRRINGAAGATDRTSFSPDRRYMHLAGLSGFETRHGNVAWSATMIQSVVCVPSADSWKHSPPQVPLTGVA